jgi:hypothetical protein
MYTLFCFKPQRLWEETSIELVAQHPLLGYVACGAVPQFQHRPALEPPQLFYIPS